MAKFGFSLKEQPMLRLVTEDTPADTHLDHALRYADLGWYVLPVRQDKKPVDGYGLNSCTRDPALIRKIWTEHPSANIAVACEKSGLVVLDIDPRNGGTESLAHLEAEHGIIYSAVSSLTQGGGEHRVFKADPDAVYPGTLGAGLDIKHRGYILVEPSRGESGMYQWQNGKNPTQGSMPTETPKVMHSAQRSDLSLNLKNRPCSIVVSVATYSDLAQALRVIPADIEYPQWLKVLQGISRLSDRIRAYEIAHAWSIRSTKPGHTEQAFKDKWRSLIKEDSEVSHLSVFHLATKYNSRWNKEPTTEAYKAPDELHPLSLHHAHTESAGQVRLFEYVYDDFMSTGVNVVAGAPGVGKTTLIIPLALASAHLCPESYLLRPRVRRNVIIITESVVQVQRVIYSLFKWGNTGASEADFNSRVKVISAQRLDPKLFAQVAEEYATWTVDNLRVDGSVFKALPCVIVDTANAVLELENENDNAQVGRAMALIKQAMSGFPLIIVAHTAKQLGSGESDLLGPRGASAWTGDAHGVYTVFKDGDSEQSPRILKASKVRFPLRWSELAFELCSHKETHPNVLGEPTETWFSHSTARPLMPGERVQLKADAKEQRQVDDWAELCSDMIDLVRQQGGKARSFYERLPRAQGGLGHSQERKTRAMESLINDGCLKVVMLDKPKGRSDHYIIVDEDVVKATDSSRYAI